MPIYEIQGPDGKVYEVDSPAMPSDEQIQAHFASMQSAEPAQEPAQPGAGSEMTAGETEGTEDAPLVHPGVLSVLGAPMLATNPARKVAEKAARGVANSKNVMRLAGGTLGATAGGTLGAMVGNPFGGATIGAYAGGKLAKKVQPVVSRGMTKVADAMSTTMPRGPKGAFGKLPAGRRMVNAVSRKLPYVGAALTAYDLLSMLGDGDAMSSITSRIKALSQGDPRAAMGDVPAEDDDAKIEELMARMRPSASH